MWDALVGQWKLTLTILPTMLVQMWIITLLVRAAIAGLARVVMGSYRARYDLIVAAHAVSLAITASFTDFVESGSAPLSFVESWVHSIAILWLLQSFFLIVDLTFRTGMDCVRSRAAS